MPGNFRQEDLRIIKTHKALLEALPKLLAKRNFGRITVNDICEESLMSRTAFYSHFNDKYDLLRYWLSKWMPPIRPIRDDYKEIEKTINKVFENNESLITNLFENANAETIELINEFISYILAEFNGKSECGEYGEYSDEDSFSTVLYSFCIGGIVSLVLWQIKNKFPEDLKAMNIHFYKILDTLRKLENNKLSGGVGNER